MSGGLSCKCKPSERTWVVLQRCCNHSAFNGNRWTPSAYSEVGCEHCHAVWRTRAKYVALLRAPGHEAG